MRNHRYAIYFTWKDGEQDSFNVDNTINRDLNISELKIRTDIEKVSYCRIYASGEYGKRIVVK